MYVLFPVVYINGYKFWEIVWFSESNFGFVGNILDFQEVI
jgi:hypothetical protein